jgi:hypothetical protein
LQELELFLKQILHKPIPTVGWEQIFLRPKDQLHPRVVALLCQNLVGFVIAHRFKSLCHQISPPPWAGQREPAKYFDKWQYIRGLAIGRAGQTLLNSAAQ